MTFKDWSHYFENNRNHFFDINWFTADKLEKEEKNKIAKSIQQFQIGENSVGQFLIKFSEEINDPYYSNAIRLFIKEEQDHSSLLGKFMGLNGIPKANSHWVDEAFRVLRRLNKLEYSIMVLLTAEITAMVYYKALRKGIKSKILRIICDQILKDEVEHIKFQCFTLWKLYNRRNNFRKKRIRLFHRMLILGTKLIVWHYHKPVFRLGRLNLKTFSQNISKEYDRADKMIKGVIEIDYVVAP